MKITEKLYIERLEDMVKKCKEYLCDHCPMSQNFDSGVGVFVDSDVADQSLSCNICRDLHSRYLDGEVRLAHKCPCKYFNIDDKTDMVAIAWKVIHNWKKDNKEK